MRTVLLIFVFSCRLISQNGWQLRPQIESKMHVNFNDAPFHINDSVNSFSYKPSPYLITNKINYGVLISRVFTKVAFETGLIYDHLSFKYKLGFNSPTHSIRHTSLKTIRYYRMPLKISFLVIGRDSVRPGKKLYSKIYFFIGKDIRLIRPASLFANYKRAASPQDQKSEIKQTEYGNNKLIIYEEMNVYIPRYISNQIGVQYAIYNQERRNIVNIGLFYSFYLKRNHNYSINRTYFIVDNKEYSIIGSNISGSALYLTLTKEINVKTHYPKHRKKKLSD